MKGPGTMTSWGSSLAAAALGLVLAGCGSASTDGRSARGGADWPPVARQARPAPARPYVGKPRPPVTVVLKGRPALESGVPGELRLTVRTRVPVTGLSLVAEGDPGLTVTAVEPLARTTNGLERESVSFDEQRVAEYRVLVTPSSGGSRSVSGQVRFLVGGVEQAAPFHLAISVEGLGIGPGEPSGIPEPNPAVDATGETLISLPAETTSNRS